MRRSGLGGEYVPARIPAHEGITGLGGELCVVGVIMLYEARDREGESAVESREPTKADALGWCELEWSHRSFTVALTRRAREAWPYQSIRSQSSVGECAVDTLEIS